MANAEGSPWFRGPKGRFPPVSRFFSRIPAGKRKSEDADLRLLRSVLAEVRAATGRNSDPGAHVRAPTFVHDTAVACAGGAGGYAPDPVCDSLAIATP